MPAPDLWSRIRQSRLVQVLVVYLGASWLVIQIVGDLQDMLQLPLWIGPVTLILLGIGLIIMMATAWVQSHPAVDARARSEEVPHSWELDLPDAIRAVKQGRLPHLTWSRALVGAGVAFCLLFGTAGLYVLLRSDEGLFGPATAAAGEAPDGIAVLPFAVQGSGIDDWREGMVDLLSTGLDGAGGVRAIASRTVLARWHEALPGTGEPDASAALDVARSVGARYALLGSAVAIGPRVRMAVNVHEHDASGWRHLGQAVVEGQPDSVLVLVDRLGMETLAIIFREDPVDLPRLDLASVTTASLPALKSYLKGEATYRSGDFATAAEEYERAIATDSMFALAHWRLSQALGWNESLASQRAREANARALELIDRLPARDALLVRATMYARNSDPAGIPLLQQAVQRYPDDAEAWYQLGDAFLHVPGALVGWEEAKTAFERAVALSPRMAPYHIHLLEAELRHDADSAGLRQRLAEFEQIAPNNVQLERFKLASRVAFARGTDALDSAIMAVLPVLRNGNMGAQIHMALSHPSFLEARTALGRAAYDHVPPGSRRSIARDAGWSHIFARGQIRAGLKWLDDPALEPFERDRAVLEMDVTGMPVPADALARATSHDLSEIGPISFQHAAYLIKQNRMDDYSRLMKAATAARDSLRTAGDTATASEFDAGMRQLDAFARWKRGDVAGAAAQMDDATRTTNNEMARWWAAMLHFENRDWKAAENHFRAFNRWSPDPLASYYLGRIYEETRRPADAREMYAFFIAQWAQADVELQPMVQEARARLVALDPER